jgi:hypothetical protein
LSSIFGSASTSSSPPNISISFPFTSCFVFDF